MAQHCTLIQQSFGVKKYLGHFRYRCFVAEEFIKIFRRSDRTRHCCCYGLVERKRKTHKKAIAVVLRLSKSCELRHVQPMITRPGNWALLLDPSSSARDLQPASKLYMVIVLHDGVKCVPIWQHRQLHQTQRVMRLTNYFHGLCPRYWLVWSLVPNLMFISTPNFVYLPKLRPQVFDYEIYCWCGRMG